MNLIPSLILRMIHSISFVGDDFDGKYICKYSGTVTGVDGWIYGVPSVINVIVKYDPLSNMTSRVGEEHGHFSFVGMAYWLEMGVFTHSTGIRTMS